MIDSRPHPPVSVITNHVTVKSDNSVSCKTSNSLFLIHPVCLVLTQYVHKVGNNLSYSIYIINNIEYDISNVVLKDILPKGVKFVSTLVEKGQYRYCKDRIFYGIPIISSHSFCKIVLNVCPTTLGKKINSIKVIGKKSKYTIHNPSKAFTAVCLNKKGKIFYIF